MQTSTTGAPRVPEQPSRGPSGGCAVLVLQAGRELAVTGRLDVRAAADVRLALGEAVAGGCGELVVDVSGLQGLDAPGLGVLVGVHRRAQRDGRVLVLRDVPPAVGRLLLLTRLDRVLRVVSSAAP